MKPALFLSILFLISCSNSESQSMITTNENVVSAEVLDNEYQPINENGRTIAERFNPPSGFERVKEGDNSFTSYLQNLPLKPHNTVVQYYDGGFKSADVYDAVVDLEIGDRDLHQCADAVMRLRAEYLWKNKQYDKIHFNFTNGFRVDYSKWREGYRIKVRGNNVGWVKSAQPSDSYKTFWKYMEIIFSYAGTLSLEKELKPVEYSKMKVGDVLIQGGSPGHAIIVVDMAVNPDSGKKVYLLAQSYMPAQEIQILKNENRGANSPWYELNDSYAVLTPEWDFYTTDLKRFVD
ncbi:MAG: DUF4846 domain-containing protein [Schleiferiaceae bacterium]|nr:DUF4846 domain-containing protein [Schleiferiaceae bacterium]